MQWAEFCVGIRAHVWKDLYMGWALRFKFRLSSSVAGMEIRGMYRVMANTTETPQGSPIQ